MRIMVMQSIRSWVLLLLFVLGAAAEQAPLVIVIVADEIKDEAGLKRQIDDAYVHKLHTLVASPHPGMRRAALLSGADAVLGQVWGARAANLKLKSSEFARFASRGARLGLAGAWGLGSNRPFQPSNHGFEVLSGSYFGRTPNSVVSITQEKSDLKFSDWAKQGEEHPRLVYHSLPWGGGESESVRELASDYLEFDPAAIILIGGGATPPLAVIGLKQELELPSDLPGVTRLLDSILFPETATLNQTVLKGRGTRHFGEWEGLRFDPKQRRSGLVTFDEDWVLVDSNRLFKRADYGKPDAENLFRDQTEKAVRLLQIQKAWWSVAEAGLKSPKRYVVGPDSTVSLTLEDWSVSQLRPASDGWPKDGAIEVSELKNVLEQLHSPGKEKFGDFTGSWPLDFRESGDYELVLQFLPDEHLDEEIAKCGAGQLTVQTGKSRVRMQVLEGATKFTIRMDIEQGPADLEAAISNQIGDLDTLLGVFFVEIRRIGEMKGARVPLAPK